MKTSAGGRAQSATKPRSAPAKAAAKRQPAAAKRQPAAAKRPAATTRQVPAKSRPAATPQATRPRTSTARSAVAESPRPPATTPRSTAGAANRGDGRQWFDDLLPSDDAPAPDYRRRPVERARPARPRRPAEPRRRPVEAGEAPTDDEKSPDYTKKRRRTRRLIEDGIIVAVAVVVAILVRAFVAQAYYIPSGSMLPQLQIDDRVVVSRLSYDLHSPRRGDIVVFKAPPALASSVHLSSDPIVRWARDFGVALGLVEDQTVVIKRVIGLPGDVVSGHDGHVYINGHLLLEPYLPKGTVTSTFGPVTIPKGAVWLMGDNRGDSYDSRYFGPIPENTIIGRAVWKVWPPWRASFL